MDFAADARTVRASNRRRKWPKGPACWLSTPAQKPAHATIEPAILYYRQVSDRAAVESQVAVWIPFGGSNGVPTSVKDNFAGNVLSYGIGPSFDVYSSGNVRFAPVVELVGWRVLSGYQTAAVSKANGTNIVNLKFGARTSWGRGASIYAGYGRALTEADWYNDIFRFEYRFSF